MWSETNKIGTFLRTRPGPLTKSSFTLKRPSG